MADTPYTGRGRRADTSSTKGHTGMLNVRLADFDKAFFSIINDFSEECKDEVNLAIHDATDYTLDEIRDYVPAGAEEWKSWKKYLKGWETKSTYKMTTDSTLYTIWNPKQYMLTHLLEKGHVMKNGKRTRAFPHVSVAAEKGMQYLDERLNKNGGK